MGYDQESRHASRGKNPALVAGFGQPESVTNEMACLLCKDFSENPCHKMRAGGLLPAVREHFKS